MRSSSSGRSERLAASVAGLLLTLAPGLASGWTRPPELGVADPPPIVEAEALLERALDYLGHPYSLGGNGSPAFDCSGFVCRVYAEAGWALPRVSRDQARAGQPVPQDAIEPGDLLFFAEPGRPISHVGIYLGDDAIVHASSGRGEVVIADLSSRWFSTRFVGARRILTSDPSRAAPEVASIEVREHAGETRLLPMVDRPAAFPEPRVQVPLASLPGSGVGLRALLASEEERWAPVLVPEASLIHPPWGLELTLAVPIRFEPEPSVGPVREAVDALRFLRRLRLGLPGARVEVALERVGSYRLGDTRLVRDLVPGLVAPGLPGLSVGRSPLTAYGAWRSRVGSLETLVDDVVEPGVVGAGLGWRPFSALAVSAAWAVDLDAPGPIAPGGPAAPGEPIPQDPALDLVPEARAEVGLHGVAASTRLEWQQGRRFELALGAEGQALGLDGRWGLGAELVARGRVSFGRRTRTALGLDLGGGVAGPGFLADLFGPSYLPHRPAILDAVRATSDARGRILGRALIRRGTWALHVDYAQGVGPAAVAADRALRAALELGGIVLGRGRVMDLRLGYATRGPFDGDGVHVLGGSARLRLSSWLHAGFHVRAGETFEAGGGLNVAWVP